MYSLSDIIEAKQRLIDRYNSPEYRRDVITPHIDEIAYKLSVVDKSLALSDLILELYRLELQRQEATSPENIEKG